MAKATVKDDTLFVEVPFSLEGKLTASRKNVLHATTELGTPDALTIQVGGKTITIQVNAYSRRVIQAVPKIK